MPVRVLQFNAGGWNPIVGGGAIISARDSLIPGTYKPNSTAVSGVYPGTQFSVRTSDVTYSSKQTVANVDFQCNVFLTSGAVGMTFTNCIFRSSGLNNSSAPGTISGPSGSLLGATFIDCTFDLTGRESAWVHCIQGSNFTLRRCILTRGHDGVGLVSAGGNVTVESCWIHNSYVVGWAAGDPNFPALSNNKTHNDAIQFHQGSNYTIRGNYLGGLRKYYVNDPNSTADEAIADTADDFDNTCIIIQQEVGTGASYQLHDVLIEKNWFQGGAASLNIGFKNSNALNNNVVIRNNRFVRRISPGGGFYIYQAGGTSPTLTGNVFDDDGTPVTITPY